MSYFFFFFSLFSFKYKTKLYSFCLQFSYAFVVVVVLCFAAMLFLFYIRYNMAFSIYCCVFCFRQTLFFFFLCWVLKQLFGYLFACVLVFYCELHFSFVFVLVAVKSTASAWPTEPGNLMDTN